jgi:hypothetical protein
MLKKTIIDKLGQVRKEIAELKKQEEELSEIVKAQVEVGHTVYGDKFKVTVRERATPEIDADKVYARLKKNIFLEIVTVSVTALKKYMLEKDIEKCIKKVNITKVISVEELKKET